MLDEGGDVVPALPQGRDDDGEDLHAEVEVFAEMAVGDHRLQVAVGGGDDADVDPDRFRSPDAVDFLLLQDPQEPHLGLGGKLPDLVQEKRPPAGPLEPSALAGDRPGEGALLVPEKLAVHQARRDGAAVDLDEGAFTARGRVVDGVGDDLLAGPGLAQQQHRAVEGRHLAHEFHDPAETVVGADNGFAGQPPEFLLKVAVVVGQKVAQLLKLAVAQAVGEGDGEGPVQDPHQPGVIPVECPPAVVEDRKDAEEVFLHDQVHDDGRTVQGVQFAGHRAGHRVVP